MNKKVPIEKATTFTLQLDNEKVTFKETKLAIVNIYSEVGLTDWEIHLNKTMHFSADESKQEIKKYDPFIKKMWKMLS